MPKVTLSNEEIKILVSWLKSKRSREMKKNWVLNNPSIWIIDRRIKVLLNIN
jgi:hypothetical protein